MELFKYPLDHGFAESVNLRKEQPEWYVFRLLSNDSYNPFVDNIYPSVTVITEKTFSFCCNSSKCCSERLFVFLFVKVEICNCL